MTKKAPDRPNAAWLERFMAGTAPVAAGVPAYRPQLSAAERKAHERIRLVREMTDAATEERLTSTARLRAARLAKEAEDRARAALEPPKTKSRPKAKG
jgi:hypothetical protein